MTRSSGVVTNPRTSSAFAPTYAVVTVIVAFSLFGYCRTLIVRSARNPTMRMTTLRTIAMTGRRMKTSVNLTTASLVLRLRCGTGVRRERVVDGDRHVAVELERARAHHLL